MFALGDGVFGSAAAFLDALVLPLLLPENEVLLRLYFLGVVWLVVVIVTKFAGVAVRGCAGDQKTYVFLPESTGPANSVDGYYWSVATYWQFGLGYIPRAPMAELLGGWEDEWKKNPGLHDQAPAKD